jgi:hypothetical protein
MAAMDIERVKEEIEQAADDRRLSCEEARALAERLGISYAEMGKACDELKVKLYGCELGCF